MIFVILSSHLSGRRARLLIGAGGCVALAALVLVWSPWRSKELWTVPQGEPRTLEALNREAADVAEHTVEAFPHDADSHALNANARLFSGKLADAAESWQRCLQLDPNRPGAYDGISLVAWEEGDLERVVATCQKALELKSVVPCVYDRLARALLEMGQAEEAIAASQRAVGRWPRSSEAHLLLGQGYIQSQEYAKAQECFLRVVEISPENPQPYYGLATASAKLGQRDKARQYQEEFRKWIAVDRAAFEALTRSSNLQRDLADRRTSTAQIYAAAASIYQRHGYREQADRLRRRAAILDRKSTLSP